VSRGPCLFNLATAQTAAVVGATSGREPPREIAMLRGGRDRGDGDRGTTVGGFAILLRSVEQIV
jgi:hypothetical protein